MRLLLITKTHVTVYEGRKVVAVFQIDGPLVHEDLEAVRTGEYK
jgi:hypothetical protein